MRRPFKRGSATRLYDRRAIAGFLDGVLPLVVFPVAGFPVRDFLEAAALAWGFVIFFLVAVLFTGFFFITRFLPVVFFVAVLVFTKDFFLTAFFFGNDFAFITGLDFLAGAFLSPLTAMVAASSKVAAP